MELRVRIPQRARIFVSSVYFVLCRLRLLLRADHSFRGILPSVCERVCVWYRTTVLKSRRPVPDSGTRATQRSTTTLYIFRVITTLLCHLKWDRGEELPKVILGSIPNYWRKKYYSFWETILTVRKHTFPRKFWLRLWQFLPLSRSFAFRHDHRIKRYDGLRMLPTVNYQSTSITYVT